MQKRDLLWLFALPAYMLLGTIRHEAAHALAIWLHGAYIEEFVILPGFLDGQFYFGYVSWTGENVSWTATAAPYFLDLLTFAVFFVICAFVRFNRRWVWINLAIIGLISRCSTPATSTSSRPWGCTAIFLHCSVSCPLSIFTCI